MDDDDDEMIGTSEKHGTNMLSWTVSWRGEGLCVAMRTFDIANYEKDSFCWERDSILVVVPAAAPSHGEGIPTRYDRHDVSGSPSLRVFHSQEAFTFGTLCERAKTITRNELSSGKLYPTSRSLPSTLCYLNTCLRNWGGGR